LLSGAFWEHVRAWEAHAGVLQRGGELLVLTTEAAKGVLWRGATQD
jgi:hypothetical protein